MPGVEEGQLAQTVLQRRGSSKSVMVKTSVDGRKVISVPVRSPASGDHRQGRRCFRLAPAKADEMLPCRRAIW